MSIFRLILRNLEGAPFRNWAIFLVSAMMAGFAIAATVLIGGAGSSIELARQRLGADIVVVPRGTETRLEDAFLLGATVNMWMSDVILEKVQQVPGVAAVTPQLYLATLKGVLCCAVPDMLLIAFDPKTDFTIQPWLEEHQAGELAVAEAVGGSFVFEPYGSDNILIYGTEVDLRANLEPTGTGIDASLFFTFETAEYLARNSVEKAVDLLEIPPRSISSVLVRVAPDADPQTVVEQIRLAVPGVEVVAAANLFQTHRSRMAGLLNSIIILMIITWILAIGLIALVFSMVVNARKREIGVLRALGADRPTVLTTLLSEGLTLALFGGMAGIGLSLLGIYFFQDRLVEWMGVPFLFPDSGALFLLVLEGLAVALITVIPAVLLPTLRVTYMDPVAAMR